MAALQRDQGRLGGLPIDRKRVGHSSRYVYRVDPEVDFQVREAIEGLHLAVYNNQVEVHSGDGYQCCVATFWATREGQPLDDALRRAELFIETAGGANG